LARTVLRSTHACALDLPHYGRIFKRANQPHTDGVGSRKALLEGKPGTAGAVDVAISELAYSGVCDIFVDSRVG
jgi:hypothetical protein